LEALAHFDNCGVHWEKIDWFQSVFLALCIYGRQIGLRLLDGRNQYVRTREARTPFTDGITIGILGEVITLLIWLLIECRKTNLHLHTQTICGLSRIF